jgi:hypothetical protein
MILSRVYGFATNNNGFWIDDWVIDTPFTITRNHNQSSVEDSLRFRSHFPISILILTTVLYFTYTVSRWIHRKNSFCCQECLFITPLPSNGYPLLSLIIIYITQQRTVYQKPVSAGTCLSSCCVALGRYVTIWCSLPIVCTDKFYPKKSSEFVRLEGGNFSCFLTLFSLCYDRTEIYSCILKSLMECGYNTLCLECIRYFF